MSTTHATQESLRGSVDTSRSYVRDGFLRAYANRFGLLALVSAVLAAVSLGFAVYTLLQPPMVIRIGKDGEPTVISGRKPPAPKIPGVLAATAASPEPLPYEKERLVQDFLNSYLNYDFNNVRAQWVAALNLAQDKLRDSAVAVIKKEDRVAKVQADQVRSTFVIRGMEQSKTDPLAYTVYGVRNVFRMDGTREIGQQMVNRYQIRLALVSRATEPRGLLISDYQEIQIEGEQKELMFDADTGGISTSTPNP